MRKLFGLLAILSVFLALPLVADASGVVAVRARVVVARPVVAVQTFHAAPVVVSPLYSAYSAPLALESGCDCHAAVQVRAFGVQRAFAPAFAVQSFGVQRFAVQRVVAPAVSIRAPFVRLRIGY